MAGVVLEQRLKSSLPDRILLQPLARVEEQAEAATAMIGVPAMVALISFKGGVQLVDTPTGPRPLIGPDGQPVWDAPTKRMMVGLKFCLASWLEVSQRTAADVKATATRNIEIEKQADELIRWIFAPPNPDQAWEDVQQEAAEHTAAYTSPAPPGGGAGHSPTPGPPPAPGGPPPPSSAFAPALTASVLS
jgi:hypothetical protein